MRPADMHEEVERQQSHQADDRQCPYPTGNVDAFFTLGGLHNAGLAGKLPGYDRPIKANSARPRTAHAEASAPRYGLEYGSDL